jgi:hypothetical protein
MRLRFHTLMIWLMLLAVPLQGFAAASMPLCEPILSASHSFTVSSSISKVDLHVHNHAAMPEQHEHASHGSADHHDGVSFHGDAKCGVCAACCVGATMSPYFNIAFESPPAVVDRLLATIYFPLSIVLANPERPPQTLFV